MTTYRKLMDKPNGNDLAHFLFDPSATAKKIEEALTILKIPFETENPDPENLHFFFREKPENSQKISVQLFLTKGEEYRLNVATSVLFSSVHISALQKLRRDEMDSFLLDLHLWTLPREPWLHLDLDRENNYSNARYGVNCPLYTEEFSLGALERQMVKVTKMAELIRILIQKHLNRLAE